MQAGGQTFRPRHRRLESEDTGASARIVCRYEAPSATPQPAEKHGTVQVPPELVRPARPDVTSSFLIRVDGDWLNEMDCAARLPESARTMSLNASVVVQLRVAGELC